VTKIIAIGGGEVGEPKEDGDGFYPVETTAIDQELVRLTEKKNPRLLFIPTASYDSVDYYERIKRHFTHIGFSEVNALYLSEKSLTKEQIKHAILSHDAIYVGGGNTLRMMNVWKKLGVDKLLKQALDNNIVLAGLSAGSICWFSCGNSDSRKFTSGSSKLIKVTGLGFIDALHCPHYDAEPFRQDDLKRMMKTTPGAAIALDNCAALEVVDGKYRIVTSKSGAKARKTYWRRGEYVVEEIKAEASYKNLNELLQK